MADGAVMMTDTKYTYQILGSAWPGHFNKPMAESMYNNFKLVGLPKWTDDDQLLAKATQLEMKSKKIEGLAKKIDTISLPVSTEPVLVNGHYLMAMGGGSDDIADISWSVPTIVLGYPSNIPGLPGHHWSNAITMATPIAHKGIIAGAKSEALTLIDLLMNPKLLSDSWDYFKNVQTKDIKYTPFISDKDVPATFLNKEIMQTFKPQLKNFYYDPSKYKTYLEQLGITYPTLRPDQNEAIQKLNEGKK
jgi:aminobenzoyl-glutamate utilization protein B